ncbi:unnamed protein product [Rotaria sp. Silwood2]|nr:unnamed protein product [Rotaria sp. Silwood2]CAF3301005.1 unnamed protein product [Rotaria sp. Silwood2]CAF3415844.1 unnamed protein product [Rotaria sp. Silwood2]CAF4456609.1 unnamed protein product [Rotaria sp. Silwood2]CAF4652420.1 unnamed protein product [Rotaria sp. Silwood2]
MAENIDKTRLTTDLRYRFEYISKFLDFSQTDITILNKLSTIIQPLIPVIVDNVYRKLFSFDITKQYLLLRHTCLDNFLSTDRYNLGFNSDAMEYRKNMLSKYLKCILTQHEWNESFLQYLSYVAKIHTDKIGSSLIHVDFIHIIALCGYLEQNLINIILQSENLDNQTKHAGIMAINKVFWIQNDFFRMHYEYDLN